MSEALYATQISEKSLSLDRADSPIQLLMGNFKRKISGVVWIGLTALSPEYLPYSYIYLLRLPITRNININFI